MIQNIRGPVMAGLLLGSGSLLLTMSHGAMANVQQELDSMFGAMSNTTRPGAYETARRGVLAGGGFKMRAKIVDTPLVSMQPPSAQAGCGGIDLFAGSFSFINADQFVQTLRSIASNAVGVASGYAFQQALDSMCAHCMANISTLQQKMQSLNQMFSNSCQLAQGLTTNTLDALTGKANSQSSNKSISSGLTDVFGSWSPANNASNKSAAEQLNDAGKLEECKDKGNVLWCAMQKNGVRSWFNYADRQIQETIMSLTGSIIVGELLQDEANKGPSQQFITLPPLSNVDFKLLLNGSNNQSTKIYKCPDDEFCRIDPASAANTQGVVIKGLGQQVIEAFNGNSTTVGIIDKHKQNIGSLTDPEKALVASLNGTPMGAMAINIAAKNSEVAKAFVSQHADIITAELVNAMLQQMISAAQESARGSQMPYAEELRRMLQEASTRAGEQYRMALAEKGGGVNEIFSTYNAILQAMPTSYPLRAAKLGSSAQSTK